MRHLFGIVLGAVLAAVASAVLLFGVGEVAGRDGGASTTGLVLVCVAGVLFGLLAALRRLSPLAPLVGGLALLAAGIAAWVRPAFYAVSRPASTSSRWAARRPAGGHRPAARRAARRGRPAARRSAAAPPRGRRRGRRRVHRGARRPPQAWRSPEGSTNAYPRVEPYQRPPLPPS